MQFQFRLAACVAALAISASSSSAQVWQTVAPFSAAQSPRQLATALEVNGAIWIVGGTPLDGSGNSQVNKYYSASNFIATTLIPLESGAQNGGVTLDAAGNILVFSGVDSGAVEGDY